MAILIIEHHPLETSARLGRTLAADGHKLDVRKPYAGDALPDFDDIDGVVVMGGPQNVDEQSDAPYLAGEIELIAAAHERGTPVVGICLGAQLIAVALGGEVGVMNTPEIGWRPVDLAFPGTIDPIMAGTPWKTVQFHSHGREVTKLPDGAAPLASSAACRTQAFKVGMRTYGFQYHFEWTGQDLRNVLEKQLAPDGVDIQPILADGEKYYDMYRHLGDRLASNLSLLLFPIDKRIAHTNRPVENFHAS